jgi:hypothetical protein
MSRPRFLADNDLNDAKNGLARSSFYRFDTRGVHDLNSPR